MGVLLNSHQVCYEVIVGNKALILKIVHYLIQLLSETTAFPLQLLGAVSHLIGVGSGPKCTHLHGVHPI